MINIAFINTIQRNTNLSTIGVLATRRKMSFVYKYYKKTAWRIQLNLETKVSSIEALIFQNNTKIPREGEAHKSLYCRGMLTNESQ